MRLIPSVLLLSFALFLATSCKTSKVSTSQKNESIKQAMAKALTWQEANPIFSKAPTDWTNGAYYTCVMKAHQSTKDPIYYDAMLNMGKKK